MCARLARWCRQIERILKDSLTRLSYKHESMYGRLEKLEQSLSDEVRVTNA